MDKTQLESSIREESERTIHDIMGKEATEMRRLDEVFANEIEGFRTMNEDRTDAMIARELSRLENRSVLERRKRRLRVIEEFINRIVDEAVSEMRSAQRYRTFLLSAAREAASRTRGRVEVCLKGDDLVFEQDILEALKASVPGHDLAVREDGSIKKGGCIVRDESGGCIFNGTIDRICFRKSPLIRREVVRILKEKGLTD